MKKYLSRVLLCFLCFVLLLPAAASAELITSGSSGEAVYRLQQRLLDLGYFNYKPTGSYGSMTRNAVIAFQQYNDLAADGAAGDATQTALFASSAKRMPIVGKVPFGVTSGSGAAGGAATPWSAVDALFPVGEVIELTDIITGTRYRVRREGGVNHAVVSLLGQYDELDYLNIFGGSVNGSKRATVAIIDGERVAASISGLPRGDEEWGYYDVSGYIDLYFTGSTGDFLPVADAEHNANIKAATR